MPRKTTKTTTKRASNRQHVTNKKQKKNKQRETRRRVKIERQEQQLAEKRFIKLLKDAEQTRQSAPAIGHARKFWELAKKEAKKGNTTKAAAYKLAAIAITSSYIPQEAQFDRGVLTDEPLGPILADPDTLVKYHHPATRIPSQPQELNRSERRRESRRKKSRHSESKQQTNKTRRSLQNNKGGSHSRNQENLECYIPYSRPTSNPMEDFIDLESDFYQYLKCLSVKYPDNTSSNTHFRYIFKTYERIMKTYQDITRTHYLNHFEKLTEQNDSFKTNIENLQKNRTQFEQQCNQDYHNKYKDDLYDCEQQNIILNRQIKEQTHQLVNILRPQQPASASTSASTPVQITPPASPNSQFENSLFPHALQKPPSPNTISQRVKDAGDPAKFRLEMDNLT
jgi:hypothetical protein